MLPYLSDAAGLRAKLKAKKTKGKPHKRDFPWLWVTVALFIATFVAVFWFISPSRNSIESQNLKAAIIDQLYAFDHLNEGFVDEITDTLESYGFSVDLYQGNEVTVDLYRKLPNYGYKLVIFRAHSGLITTEGEVMKSSIFTSEPYSQTKYVKEQLNDELLRAHVDEGYPFYFAIDSKFITNKMKGRFDNTVIIIAACSCLYLEDLAQAFINKGASAYLAWDATVDLDYVDEATISLIKNLCSESFTVEKAVGVTMATKGPDPKYDAILKYYPLQSGDKTLKQLIANEKVFN